MLKCLCLQYCKVKVLCATLAPTLSFMFMFRHWTFEDWLPILPDISVFFLIYINPPRFILKIENLLIRYFSLELWTCSRSPSIPQYPYNGFFRVSNLLTSIQIPVHIIHEQLNNLRLKRLHVHLPPPTVIHH